MDDHHQRFARPRVAVVRPLSNRTLYHPSFLPVYMSTASAQYSRICDSQTIPSIIPSELFYTDPTMSCGKRIPNIVSELNNFECFRLNTPPPVMSVCPTPPNTPDPFTARLHPMRNLGSSTWRIDTPLPPVPPFPSSQAVLELTQEEDQAITNLLKLHYQEPIQSHGNGALPNVTPPVEQPARSCDIQVNSTDIEPGSTPSPSRQLPHYIPPEPISTPEVGESLHSDGVHRREANLGGQIDHGLLEEVALRKQNHSWDQCGPDYLQYLQHHYSSVDTETQPLQENCPAVIRGQGYNQDSMRDYPGYMSFGSLAMENGEALLAGSAPVEAHGSRNVGDVLHSITEVCLPSSPLTLWPQLSPVSSDSQVENGWSVLDDLRWSERMLSQSEGTAVHALLSLGDDETQDIPEGFRPLP